MSYYRLYYSAPADRHFAGVIDFLAENDTAALRKAATCVRYAARELWSKGRRVGAFDPAPLTD